MFAPPGHFDSTSPSLDSVLVNHHCYHLHPQKNNQFNHQDGDHLVGVLKSKTVPATEATDPVGINLSETGVKLKEREVRRYAKKMKRKEVNKKRVKVCDPAREGWTKKKKDKEEDVKRRRRRHKNKSTCQQPSSSHDPQARPPQSDSCDFDQIDED